MAGHKRKPGRPKGSKNKETQEKLKAKKRLRDEIWAIVIMAIGAFLVLSLHTEATGGFGQVTSDILKGLFSSVAYILPYYLIINGILLFIKSTAHFNAKNISFLIVIFLVLSIMNSGRFLADNDFSFTFIREAFSNGVVLQGGGAFGMSIGLLLKKLIGIYGLYILCSVLLIISIMLVINTPVSYFIEKLKIERKERNENQIVDIEDSKIKVTSLGNETIAKARDTISSTINPKQMKIIDYMKDEKLFSNEDKEEAGFGLEEPSLPEKGKGLEPIQNNETKKVEPKKEEDLKVNIQDITYPYKLPPINLLSKSPSNIVSGEEATLKSKAIKLEQTLQNFGVNAKVLQVTKGPAITRYEIQPNVGVKVSSIVRLADDIALNLEAKSIRIEAPIPGKAAVGIEVENERVNLVTLRDILDSREFKTAKSKLTFAVGKDISGTPIVTDLKEMPHLLIAGSTGSGKSVCINSVIISILYRAKPDEVKFVLIDPKVVELCNYNGIPHLLIPVVTEPSKAAAALNWAVSEMTNRYQKFAEEGVRDLDSYNDSMRSKGEKNEVMPQIVIIIDELADLMMAAPSQVEESICRLAQMARAAGMHLIVATQRPSVDVITGVIKANVPSRISFAVSSQFDSRTILDMAGAEKLVGKGDMLFSPLGISKPIRVQGSFISDTEVHKVIDYIKKQVPENQYSDDVLQSIEKTYDSSADSDSDELLQDAIQTIIAAQTASVSMLQRRFRIGYNRAARLIDMMEARGIVGPSEGSKPRKVLMTEEQYSNLGKDQEER